MFDTNIVVVGNVLAAPEWRRIPSTGALVAHFRVASHARRFDRESNRWVDGNSLRVRVTAWRRLAEGVASSITTGDPVIVSGRLYTRDWTDDQGNHRTSYEMEALAVGHDLARGRARFYRSAKGETSTVSDGAEEVLVGGEPSVPIPAEQAPAGYGDGLPERLPDEDEPTFADVVGTASDVMGTVPEVVGTVPEVVGTAPEEELAIEVERLAAEQPSGARRGRRSAKREPVAA